MRILQINVLCGYGSTGRIATDIHQELIADNHTSQIAFGRKTARNCDNAYKIGTTRDILLDVAMTRLFDRHGVSAKKATRDLCEWIDANHPDIIHLHNIHGYYVNIRILMSHLKAKGYPVVWTLHDCWSFTGHCAYFDFPKCDRWLSGCGSCPKRSEYPTSWFRDRSAPNYREKIDWFTGFNNLTIVTPSEWLKKLVQNSFLSMYPIEVIHNGIDLEQFHLIDSSLKKELGITKKVILGVAMVWDRRKGLDDMIKLAELLEEDYQVILIGLDQKQINRLPNFMRGVRRTSSTSELAEYYSMAEVTVVTSYEDNYPTVVLESLACRTQVVAYRTGGIPEMAPEPYLHVVEKGDVQAIADVIKNGIEVEWKLDPTFMDRKIAARSMIQLYNRQFNPMTK